MTQATNETTTNSSEITVDELSQGLEFSASSALSGKLPAYDSLDDFAQSSENPSDESESVSELTSETDSETGEEITDEDATAIMAFGIEQVEAYVGNVIEAPIDISDKHRSEIAKKGAVLVQKYLPGGTLPPWLIAWKAEIEFGLAVGTCAFSIYQQKKAHDAKMIEQKQVDQVSEV